MSGWQHDALGRRRQHLRDCALLLRLHRGLGEVSGERGPGSSHLSLGPEFLVSALEVVGACEMLQVCVYVCR